MRSIDVDDAQQNFLVLIDAVEAGEEVRIARQGRDVVRMLPLPVSRQPVLTPMQIEAEMAALDRLRSRVEPGPGWRELRDEGRE